MKLKQGDVLVCGPEKGCGIKLVVIEACAELDCDLSCCGQEMSLLKKKGGPEPWSEGSAETAPDIWKKYAQTKEE